MIETITAAAKMKAFLAAFALLLSGVGLYEIADGENGILPASETPDQFTLDIQEGSDRVYNTVTEAVNQQGKQNPIAYKQTCESSIAFIKKERLNTEHNYNTLDEGQKETIQAYRAYLKESASVVTACYAGQAPDRSGMNTTKAALY